MSRITMTNNSNRRMMKQMTIETPIQDVVVDKFACAIFECEISDCCDNKRCKWYKDGKEVKSSYKFIITCNGKWHQLKIMMVTDEDHGLYVLFLSNNPDGVLSKANLYVRHINDSCNNVINDVIYLNSVSESFNVVRHLKCTQVKVGDTIDLGAEFNADVVEDFMWYKGNCPLKLNDRMIFLNDKRTTNLAILQAKDSDTGIYHVVCQSQYGVASSFTSVIVINTNQSLLNINDIVPSIDETLPDDIEVNEGDDMRIMCKASYNQNTEISWFRNDIEIKESKNISTAYYNNTYICLTMKSICRTDTGEYSIVMHDKTTGLIDSSKCFVNVNEIPNHSRCIVQVVKALDSAVTCFGSRISFTCSFAVEDPKFFYVVWYVGRFRVERTNHTFHMMNSGGEFYLVIKQVEPGMAGDVICELRKSLPSTKSILINSTAATLTIVPNSLIETYENTKTCISLMRNNKVLYYNGSETMEISLKNNILDKLKVSSLSDFKNIDNSRSIVVITYCRLEDEYFYLSASNDDGEINISDLMIYRKSICGQTSEVPSKLVVIEWCDDMQINKANNSWYSIEMGGTSKSFVHAGISSVPMFEIKDPPMEQVMKFRISRVNPLKNLNESKICIEPREKELLTIKRCYDICPIQDFEEKFTKTGDVIGCGAFGNVVLARDKTGEFYAAKILKTRTQKKRETAVKEYEIMKQLRHPKLVELHDAFSAKGSFILVMDYLWGGELFDRIVNEEHIKEVDVVPYVRQICEALLYLHERKIAHLDLKPENIICLSPNSRLVKIIDFGLARVLDDDQVIRAIYGTRDYVAPEVLNFDRLTLACDMWSLGVVTYMLLSGVMPFSGDSWPERSANITMANYNYHESAFKDISDSAKDFVDNLLILKPNKRMSALTALNHQWTVKGPPGGARSGHMKRARENLKSYLANHRARWQRVGNVLIAAHRLRRTHFASQQST